MRGLSVPFLVGLVLVATPLPGAALDYKPVSRLSTFVPIDPDAPGVLSYNLSSAHSVDRVMLPFSFAFYGSVFNQVNISRHGYVSFSSRPGTDDQTNGHAAPGKSTNQSLPDPTVPNGVIAAWWDSFTCPNGTIKTQEAVIQGSLTFTVEWNGCYVASNAASTVQMQIRLTENSPVIRVYYGELGSGTGAHTATMGIENPARWRQDTSTGEWTLLTAGGTEAVMPTACGSTCSAANWPKNQMIQYGRPEAPDLQAGVSESGAAGLEVVDISGYGTVTFQLRNAIENGGLEEAAGVTWDYYLSTDDVFDPAVDRPLGCSHTNRETIPGATTLSYTDTCIAPIDPGLYRICAFLDPVTDEDPDGAIIEANEENNAYCSGTFAVGADLIGSLTVSESAVAGGMLDIPVRIENRGNDPTPEFKVQIWLRECDAFNGMNDILAWETSLSFGGFGIEELLAEVPIGTDAADSYCVVLLIDPGEDVPEKDEINNSYSSCVSNGDLPKQCAVISLPDLRIGQFTVDLPDGCFFGDPIGLAARVCNDQVVDTWGFGLAFFLDGNTIANIDDPLIVSVPQTCSTSDECAELGGGESICIDGICHAPCEADTDCGTGDLQCMPSSVIPGRSCQLAIKANSCGWIKVTADLPTVDIRTDAEFQDGDIFFSAIVDWTVRVSETDEDNNKAVTGRNMCWSRKPDFEAAEVRTLPEIASGEVMPVYRRVINRGVVGGVFGYRYVLSSNDTISVDDLALEIEGVGAIGEDSIGPRAEVAAHDFVRLPAGIVPGEYYLGIILDPENRVVELLKNDNTALTTKLAVVDASLRVVTSSLRDATAGATYAVQLLASGRQGDLHWSHSDGSLPPGFVLEADGLLHGTPSRAGTYLFQVRATSGGRTASRYLALDVLWARGPLALASDELPPAFQGIEYRAMLSASGGLPPYRWACLDLPPWLSLQNNLLHGTSTATADPATFSCAVMDEYGTMVSRKYSLGVYPASGIRIRSQELSGDVGGELSSCLVAQGGSGKYGWSFDPSSAPAGIGFAERDNEGCFSGVPKECGTYLVGVTATDEESGLSDTRRLSLSIHCRDLQLTTRNLPIAERGSPYEARLEVGSSVPVVFELAGGALPQGLALSADGTIAGVVAIDATGTHQAAVRFYNEEGGSGLEAISIAIATDSGPDVTITNTKTLSGCSASGQGPAAGLLPFAVVALLSLACRRSSIRWAAPASLAAAALLLPAAAVAQVTPGYATYQTAKRYERLDDGEVVLLDASNSHSQITLDGWKVPFFGELYESMWLHENGLILFSTPPKNTSSWPNPYPIPYVKSTDPVRNFLAGWWDNHTVLDEGTYLRYKIRGTAPNRELVVEWVWKTQFINDGDDGGEHQVSLFEDGTIAFRWGEIVYSGISTLAHRGVMGLMDREATARSVPFHACSAYTGYSTDAICDQDIWNDDLRNTEAIFTILPNLQVRSASIDSAGRIGLDHTFFATVYNDGPYSTPVRVRFYVSRDEQLSVDDISVGTSEPFEVGAFAEREVELEATLPLNLDVGRYYLIAVADPDDVVKEYVETDNVGPASAFSVIEPRSDLTLLHVGAPASGGPGSGITVELKVQNLGNLAGTDFPFAVVLSENSVITISDRTIHEGTLTVGALQTAELRVPVTIPTGTPAGVYYLGVVLDPYGKVTEFDKLNNNLAVEHPFSVVVSGLTVRTVAPQTAQIGAVYCISLVAEGGEGVYTWSRIDGTLPPGLDLIPGGESGNAALCGRPTAVGLYRFVLGVVSGNLSASTEMSLEVTNAALAFGISSGELPTARFQSAYEAGLIAFGGTPPYAWTLEEGVLPIGLSFQDDGMVFGAPREAGTFSLRVSVSDSENRSVTGTVTLLVVPPTRITCASETFGTIALGEPFTGKLLAAGGPGSYEWTTQSIRRVSGSGSQMIAGEAPPGLDLGILGDITGTPEQVGSYIWTLEVRSAVDDDFDVCPVTVTVAGGQGLTVATTVLPDAVPGEEYTARLWAINGDGNLTWTLATGSRLPDGISLDPTGLLSGTPTLAALRDDTSRTFGFRVEVRDDRNLQGTGLLSLTVTQAPETGGTVRVVDKTVDDGCQAAGGGFSLAALGLVMVALARRISRMNHLRIAILGMFVALAIAGCSDDSSEEWKSITTDLCVERGTVCDPAGLETCDPVDGLCKCGGYRGVICGPGMICRIEQDLTPPAPSCVSELCDKVVCRTYEACDAMDGHCKCQGELCGEGQICLADGCSGDDPCAGVVCAQNQVCDPSDRICKCGGNTCSVGETCRNDEQGQGHCVGRNCVGKNCPSGTECNPADGLCHCGTADGDVCTAGQACVVKNQKSVCEGYDICEGVVCSGNTTCSPLDGECRCGGFTSIAPICSPEQTCDTTQDPPRCAGGDACEGVTCTAGTNLSCDGETGECRCGGTGGVKCASGESCVDSSGAPTCVTPCDPTAVNVAVAVCGQVTGGARKGCYLSPADGLSYCADAGTRSEGALCEVPTDCVANYHCVATERGGVCRQYCDYRVPGDCGDEGRSCVLLSSRPATMPYLGVCLVVTP